MALRQITGIDRTFAPEPLVNGLSVSRPSVLRVYSSPTFPGALSVVTRPEGDPFAPLRGLRLTRAQVETLRDALTEHLEETA